MIEETISNIKTIEIKEDVSLNNYEELLQEIISIKKNVFYVKKITSYECIGGEKNE